MKIVSNNGTPIVNEQDQWDLKQIDQITGDSHRMACMLYGISPRFKGDVVKFRNARRAASNFAEAMADLREIL
jgi:hypothetical protein